MAKRGVGGKTVAAKGNNLPSRDALLKFIRENPGKTGKREIGRAFGLKGSDRIWLKQTLKSLESDGLLPARGDRKSPPPTGGLPAIAVLDIHAVDSDGDLLARPVSRNHEPADMSEKRPDIHIARLSGHGRQLKPALGAGDRILTRLKKLKSGAYEADIIRRLPKQVRQFIGIYRKAESPHRYGRIVPTNRRVKSEIFILEQDRNGAEDGDLVSAENTAQKRHGLAFGRIVQCFGDKPRPGHFSTIAIHEHGIRNRFPDDVVAAADACSPARLQGREDLRQWPFVTIDGADARDFDDAVFAVADDDPANAGGWRISVAIADVAYYVRPGAPLDQEAQQRGNSVYFPDLVIPMLPERLSNDLCSLRQGKNRPVLVCHMVLSAQGEIRRHRFRRAMIRSAGRLTYEQVEAAKNGHFDDLTETLNEPVITPLFAAFKALSIARRKRQPLDLEIPELAVRIGSDGEVESIQPRQRLAAHRLIEEYMISANVCAAETLTRAKLPCMFRIHDEPDREKMRALADYLGEMGFRVSLGEVAHARLFNRIIAKARKSENADAVNQAILRSQSMAVYAADNIGHFGLSLQRYAHFTSPIRRYADLLVHRALLQELGARAGAMEKIAAEEFDATATAISQTERVAQLAERDTMDRYLASYTAAKVGRQATGRINGISDAGLFITLSETGADGLLPMRRLGGDYFRRDASGSRLVGDATGTVHALGDVLEVTIENVDPLTGSILLSPAWDVPPEGAGKRRGHRRRQGRR